MSIRLLNSISSRICRQNTQFNMYTSTSKQQEGCTFKDSHPKCFITTNFDEFHREAVAKGGERGEVLTACFRDIQSQRSIRMGFVTRRLQRRSLRLPTRSKSAQTGHLCTTAQARADPGIFVCRSKFPGLKVGRRS